jgi:glycosyltransferase involved in cell wall biosynthesis
VPPMRVAAHGLISDGGGSGAGAFSVLLRGLLDQGHEVSFYGVPGFTEPTSLGRFSGYRYVPLLVPELGPMYRATRSLPVQYPHAVVSVIAHAAYQRQALRKMEEEPRATRPDFVLCLDALNLWRSQLPVLSWPQSPPQTEWEALRTRDTAAAVLKASGPAYLAAVNVFYAYRYLQARLTLPTSDALIISSRWSSKHWVRFGLAPERVVPLPYPIDVECFASVAPRPAGSPVTFLWLGRAVPRKRLDLFLEGFAKLRQRAPGVRALLVGNLAEDAVAARILEAHRGVPGVEVRPAVPRSDVGLVLAEADVVVQPSENENFGFAVAEALAAGRPVVVGATNGTGDYPGEAGFSFEHYDADSVAAAMDRARVAVEADRMGLSEIARRAAREHFATKAVVSRLLSLASGVIARHASGR